MKEVAVLLVVACAGFLGGTALQVSLDADQINDRDIELRNIKAISNEAAIRLSQTEKMVNMCIEQVTSNANELGQCERILKACVGIKEKK